MLMRSMVRFEMRLMMVRLMVVMRLMVTRGVWSWHVRRMHMTAWAVLVMSLVLVVVFRIRRRRIIGLMAHHWDVVR